MKLPESQNANHQYAFKKGYRFAQDGKSLSGMPSAIRYDAEMREYFQQGWSQFQDDIAQAEDTSESPWRRRAAWIFMMMLAGIGTASLMVGEMEQSKLDKQMSVSAPQAQKPVVTAKPEKPLPLTTEIASFKAEESLTPVTKLENTTASTYESEPLSLLNNAAREDLLLNKAEQKEALTEVKLPKKIAEKPLTEATVSPIIESTIKVSVSQITRGIANRQAVNDLNGQIIPKSIRELYYFTMIEGANGQTLYHRWIYKKQVMATIALTIQTDNYRTWSSKRLSSAWQGEWTLEVLDANKDLIHSQKFRYVK